jgi:hypothetical protein
LHAEISSFSFQIHFAGLIIAKPALSALVFAIFRPGQNSGGCRNRLEPMPVR